MIAPGSPRGTGLEGVLCVHNRVALDTAGLAHPKSPIRDLCLPFNQIDDRGLARLRSMPSLDEVFLDGTKISDLGLESLTTQPKIRFVHANGTGVIPSGVDAFRAKKPRGVVKYGLIQNSPYFFIR
jgi:hypothetical protein